MSNEPPSDPMIGRTLVDRYRIDEPVARGGMARVYRARDVRLERDVAVKVLSHPYADDPAFTDRFLAEARAVASLSHPSLVHVYDSGSDGEAHFIVMELLDRHRSLRQAIDEGGPMAREDVLRIGRELLAGLRAVHDRGLVHCDVKSGNVMLGPGPAKLIDFGIARPPHEGLEGSTSIGSLQFMSPEQLHGEALTPASDLFSLGVVLYEALTATMPYEGRTPEEISAAHLAHAVRAPSTFVPGVPGRLDDAILQALRREPTSRFGSAEAMSRALEAADAESTSGNEMDETRVVAVSLPPAERSSDERGYVPPPAPRPTRPSTPAPALAPARGAPARRSSPRRSIRPLIGTLVILAAVALVVALVTLPLLDLGGSGEASPQPSASESAPASAPAGTVLIPATIGMSTADAIERASEAGLNWRVECAQDPAQPEGIIGQEPPEGTSVAPGSRFTMFSARISDCR
ncbi:MAG: serine/threonine protein kinase [Chloroflexi bacterium]|nr:serine/threonine protein kinase [Chloroflexota bacterium]